MMTYDEEMNVDVLVTPNMADTKAKEQSFRKRATLFGITGLLLLIVAAATTLNGVPTAEVGLFDRQLQSKGGSSGGDSSGGGSSGGGDDDDGDDGDDSNDGDDGDDGDDGNNTGGGTGSTTPYTSAEVAAHSTANDCWTIISGKVYDLSSFSHSGGAAVITAICGKDGTASYQRQHGTSIKSDLNGYQVGVLDNTGSTGGGSMGGGSMGGGSGTATTFTAAEVAAHATANDCWTSISGKVYDLTGFVNQHSGGSGTITAVCGKDGTANYQRQHGTSIKSTLNGYLKGDLV